MAIFYPPSPRGVADLIKFSLGKRKREYDMARGYYGKRRRLVTYKPRRKKRGRRAYNRPRAGMAYKSNYGLGTFGHYYASSRKKSLGNYRRYLFNSTKDQRHYRSIDTTTGILNTPTFSTGKVWEATPLIPLEFYQPPRLQLANENRTFDRHVTVRGGLSTLTFKNKGTDTVRIEVYNIWMVQHRAASYPPEANAITNTAEDPTNFSDAAEVGQSNGREFLIKRRRSTLLEPGAVWSVMDKLKVAKIHLQDYNSETQTNDRKMFYWFAVESPGEDTTDRVDWQKMCSMSFSGDVIQGAPTGGGI